MNVELMNACMRLLKIKPSVFNKRMRKYSQLGMTKEQFDRIKPPVDIFVKRRPLTYWGR